MLPLEPNRAWKGNVPRPRSHGQRHRDLGLDLFSTLPPGQGPQGLHLEFRCLIHGSAQEPSGERMTQTQRALPYTLSGPQAYGRESLARDLPRCRQALSPSHIREPEEVLGKTQGGQSIARFSFKCSRYSPDLVAIHALTPGSETLVFIASPTPAHLPPSPKLPVRLHSNLLSANSSLRLLPTRLNTW